MNKKLIVANWKMLPESLAQAQEILEFTDDYLGSLNESKELGLVICPPFLFTEEVAKILETSHLGHSAVLGAQDISTEDRAALTGEVSGPMLQKLGVQYVIIGHSERRWKLGESDELVNKKLKAALRNGMVPIVCIGERTREEGYKKFLEAQITATFRGLSADEGGKCIIAYEPVWAISTNPDARPDTPASALESMGVIKEVLTKAYPPAGRAGSLKPSNLFLYGGSINSKNARDFLKEEEISGVLIGGASVNKEEFVKILEVVSTLK